MARLILVLVAIGLVIFLVRAFRRKPPDKGPDQQLPPPDRRGDRSDDGDAQWHDREDHNDREG